MDRYVKRLFEQHRLSSTPSPGKPLLQIGGGVDVQIDIDINPRIVRGNDYTIDMTSNGLNFMGRDRQFQSPYTGYWGSNKPLIRIGDNEYLYASEYVYRFRTPQPIRSYVVDTSALGRPISVAYADNYVYMLDEMRQVPIANINYKDPLWGNPKDPRLIGSLLMDYYGHSRITNITHEPITDVELIQSV